RLKQLVTEFKQGLPLIAALRNTSLKQRHWEEIQYAIGRSLTRDATLTLGDLLKWRLFQHRDLIMEISTRATNEATLLTMLNKLINTWQTTDFKLVAHTSGPQNVMIVSTAEEIWNQLEESQMTIATIKGSRYVTPIKGQVEDWERKLMLFSRTLDEWMQCQRNWLYLEPVFTTIDIQRQLPTESQLFSQVDKSWREIMRRTEDRPNALRAATGPGVLESLQLCNSNLEKIQKCLEDYLELKRLAFPRFYFLSNDELLSVLSHGREPVSIQPHLVKCFANIKYLDIRGGSSKAPNTVHAMISAEGETVAMPKYVNVRARGSVENWLSSVEGAMIDTVRKHLRMALLTWTHDPNALVEWMLKYPGQVVLTVVSIFYLLLHWNRDFRQAQIMFNKEVTKALSTETPEAELQRTHQDFINILNYFTLEALIIIYVHIRDIIADLIKLKVTSPQDFQWTRQLLYEWQDASNMCKVVQAEARFTYGCEYIGCASRLVITPLTDRCFLTLTGALNLHLGGSPAGPAGTGKSETVKDLAKIMGKQCVVFNCSEGIDFKMTGQFFSGLSQSGAWCCFDEFNRIDVEVLSVIASQVHSIKAAMDAQVIRFMFEGREIKLNASCAYFITMNPGYLGRVELPDNLKSLFRPVAMMVPDYALITEIILFSEGFQEAKLFSRKIVNLYDLASKQLSQQDHYDFGMRAIKSVLVMAGQKKQSYISSSDAQDRNILIHSLRNANLPRFLAEDAPLFNNIMSDLFPGISPPKMDNSALEKAIEQATTELGLELWTDQLQKAVQLKEQLAVRHGVMLVGPSGGGKTTVRTVLQRALTSLYSSLAPKHTDESFSINPKCVSLGELYGYTDPNTLEWVDGMLAYLFSTTISNGEFEWRWVVLDGPVDTAWVENLNTTLDDTKTLCLANGERINMPDNMRIMFEVDTLTQASPATISRCAMVYMDPVKLGWKPYVKSWIKRLPKDLPQSGRDHLWDLFELSIETGLQLLEKRLKLQHIPVPQLSVVQTLCRILQVLIGEVNYNRPAEVTSELTFILGRLFVFAFTWSVGGVLNREDDQEEDTLISSTVIGRDETLINMSYDFDQLVHDIFEKDTGIGVTFPSGSRSIFSYFVDLQVIRYSFLSALLLLNKFPVLLTGDSGVGKTALIQRVLLPVATKAQSGDLVINTIQFSALTQPSQCQAQMMNKLVKRSRDSVGPPRGKKCIAFVNDLNMPSSDKHGSQPPLELLRQFIDLGGFYDVKKLTWKGVVDVTLAATAAPPGGGREISSRLLKHFSVFAMPQPSTKSLQHIYKVQLGHFFENRDFMPEVKESCPQVVNAGIAVYYKMCNAMLPTPDKSHYTFNLRDLSDVIKGVLQADESVIVSRETIAHLFAHEATRVFHDRLTDATDRSTFHQFLSDDLHNYFKQIKTLKKYVAVHFKRFITIPAETLQNAPIIFGDFLDMNAPSASRMYRQLPSHNMLSTLLEEYYMRISSSLSSSPPLIFFEAAIDHVVRAARVFRQPGAHLLLVGIDGTGKVTTCKLAARIAGCQVYSLSIVRGYSLVDFRDELKKVFRICGVSNKPTVLLLTDADLVSEAFLEDINCILNTGREDAELFDQDELDGIVMEVKQDAIAHDVPDSRAAMLKFFQSRVSRNLHITLATSPAGGNFRRRCRTHPALVNCCTIDWYDRWPEEALMSVACAYFTRENIDESISGEKIASVCVQIHFSAAQAAQKLWEEMRRRYYITPTTYLEFVQLFTKMLSKNKQNFHRNLGRLHTGLRKLAEAKSMVSTMREELIGLGPKIEVKAQDTERLMAQLKKDTQAVNEVRELVRNEEQTMRNETQMVQDFAQQATLDLQAVLPALQEAVQALDSLDKSDLAVIRVYIYPPLLVVKVMNAVCVLLQVKPDWPQAKQLMADPQFLKKMVQLDRDAIPDRVFAKVRRITRDPDFTPEQVEKVSSACTSMCMWVLALQHYNDVKRMVEPKQRRVQEAREALQVAQDNLKKKQASLHKIESHLTQLSAKYDESVAQQEALKKRRVITGKRLERAAILIHALADEEGRWNESVDNLNKKLCGLIGDTMVSAASVAYLGPFIQSYRHDLTSQWVQSCHDGSIVTSQSYDMVRLMADSNKVRTWHTQDLPRDVHSIENAVIIDAARRWPLIVDPQGQAINWIKKMEKQHLRVVYAGDANYMKVVENAIRVGETLLLCGLSETLDPELKPVLQMELITGNPLSSCEVFLKVSCVCIKLSKYLKTFLFRQSNYSENERRTEAARSRYMPVATRGAVLYFVVADLEVLNPMYQFSLQWFSEKFIFATERPSQIEEDKDFLKLLHKMVDVLTNGVYEVVSYSLFAEHKIVFSFLLACAIMRNNAKYGDQWKELVDAGLGEVPRTPFEWVTVDMWRQCRYISLKIAAFDSLSVSMVKATSQWELFHSHPQPYELMATKQNLDDNADFDWTKISSFGRLILIKLLRPECLLPSVRSFVRYEMGETFVTSKSLDLVEIYKQSVSNMPLIFVLSPGTDPSAQLLKYAKETRGSTLHVDMVSLGRGQGPKAEDLIHKAQILKGRWVFLQNCHLAASFMPRLQAIVEDLNAPGSEVDSEFRLWLSSKPDHSFPVPILQKGLKMAVEPPRGIRSHLELAFGSSGVNDVTPDLYSHGSPHKNWNRLLFALCCFNALAHERQKYGTLGFNLSYDFTASDLEVSILMLQQLLGDSPDVPWLALRHLTGLIGACFFQVRESIMGLPLSDPPDVFGMHDNAEKAFMESEANRLINVIINVQPKLATASHDGLLNEAELDSELTLAKILTSNVWSNSALLTVARQEIDRFNRLLHTINVSLRALSRALSGEIVMSDSLEQAFSALLLQRVPETWQAVSYESCKPLGSWLEDLLQRVEFFSTWSNLEEPTSYWVSAFFFPQGFLTAVLQNYARKHKIPVDSLTFNFHVRDFAFRTTETPLNDGVRVFGLFMDSGRWDVDQRMLQESLPNIRYFRMPEIIFMPVQQTEDASSSSMYSCPLYRTSRRAGSLSSTGHSTNFVTAVNLETDLPSGHWTLRGTALLVSVG
uniref:AAA+ ATPase domain-containing protein n=1 Tax=Ciona savignyi TaxID=51511 RepID=H2YVP9_CIOSA